MQGIIHIFLIKEGIYSKTRRLQHDSLPYYVYLQSKDTDNYTLVKKIIGRLKIGDSISDLYRYAKIVDLEEHEKPKGIERFLTVSIKSSDFERDPDNKNLKTFDRIRISCGILSSSDFFDKLEDDEINQQNTIKKKQSIYVRKNYILIVRHILNKIENSRLFKKYGIPINFLRVTNFSLKNDSSIQVLFELKGLGKDDQNNSDNYDSEKSSDERE